GADGRDLAVLEEGVGVRVAEVRVAPDEHHGRIPGARSAQVRLDLAAVAPDRRPREYRTAGDEADLYRPRTLRSQIVAAQPTVARDGFDQVRRALDHPRSISPIS